MKIGVSYEAWKEAMTPQRRRVADRISELIDQRRPFVQATVVRAQCPTSARPGDAAVVLGDGSIEGFVGGQCAEGSVRVAALDLLEHGESVLLRVLPEDAEPFPPSPGSVTVVNPCLSGGALEIYLEPKLPAPELVVVGRTPIADALVGFGQNLGFAMTADPDADRELTTATAVLVASHGRSEEETIRRALDAGVGFVGLVASTTRGNAVVDSLDLNDEERAVVHSPVGFHIGAKTAEEIAVSILAEVVRAVRLDGLRARKSAEAGAVSAPVEAIDPICGMTVIVQRDTPHLVHEGVDYWYCNPGCRTRHESEL